MTLSVHVWSDIVCPWCFIGKRRLERAITLFGEEVDVIWHSFELDPRHTQDENHGLSQAERLAAKYQMSVARAQAMMDEMEERGKSEGIDFSLNESKTVNSFDAHRLLQWAADSGQQGAMAERLFVAHFSEGVDCSHHEELVRLAGEIGLNRQEAQAVLSSDRFALEVRADQSKASELNITGVPYFVIGTSGIGGAQSAEVLLQALDQANLEEGAAADSAPEAS